MAEDNDKRALEEFGARLDELRTADTAPDDGKNPQEQQKGNALSLAFRVGVELISAVAVGTAIGWGLDEWLDTRPWLMLVFIALGGAAGILNVYRLARGFGYAAGYPAKHEEAGDLSAGGDEGNKNIG